MFKVNDYIVCGANGVCKVIDIVEPSISVCNGKGHYYKLQPVYEKESVLYIPIENNKVLMRKVISRNEVDELIKDMPSIELLSFDSDRECEMKYKEILRKYDCRECFKIIRTSYLRNKERLSEGKKATCVDEKYLKIAEDYVYGEFALVLDIPKDEVKDFIFKQIEKEQIPNAV